MSNTCRATIASLGFALVAIGIYSVATFNPFQGNGIVEVVGGFLAVLTGGVLVGKSGVLDEE